MNNIIIGIFGQKHCGKSYLANKLANYLLNAGRRIILISPADDRFNLPGAAVIRSAGAGPWRNLEGRSALVFPEEDQAAFGAISFSYQVGNLWLIIDEIDNYLGYQNYYSDLMRIVRYGRHRSISLVGICQRPASVNKALIAQADLKILFRTEEPNDLAYLRKWIGIDAERLARLPDRKYLLIK